MRQFSPFELRAASVRTHLDMMTGLPRRMVRVLANVFADMDVTGNRKHLPKLLLVNQVMGESDLIPLNAPESALHQAADASARECYRICVEVATTDAILCAIGIVCRRRGVDVPKGATNGEIIKRALDKAWWNRALRRTHARRFEHVAIQLGFTSYRTGAYVSNETAQRQRRRNKANAKLLAGRQLQNEHGQIYSLEALAALGVSNKAIRRGELMTRIRGFEEIASDLKDVGVFATITAPSKYHAVLSKSGEPNPKYTDFGSPTPRDAQAYLCRVWASIRAKLHRDGIRAYGFRIAEPHHDGCPHWHMLMFVAQEHREAYEKTITAYALAEDFGEWKEESNRVKLVRIEAGKGTAAGYIAKYVAKNIDGECVGDHKTLDGDIVTNDLLGDAEITPSERVGYWAQTWGIRQFQQVGGAPVGVWRELRRVTHETVMNAPAAVKAAHQAVQKIDGSPEIAKQASWADFLRAMGGPCVGRCGEVRLATRMTVIEGKYATYDHKKPCGVYAADNADAVYESVRFTWSVVGEKAVAVAVPWTGVNNCTGQWQAELAKRTVEAMGVLEKQNFDSFDWWQANKKRSEQEKYA